MIIFRLIYLQMRNVSKLHRKSRHFIINTMFPKIVPWKNMIEPDRPQMAIQPMRFAC